MDLQYDVTEKDWELAQATSCEQYSSMIRSSLLPRLAWWSFFVFLCIALASSAGMFSKYGESVAFDLSFVLGSALLASASLAIFRRLSARSAKAAVLRSLEPFPLEHRLMVSDRGIDVTNRHGRSIFPWASVLEVRETSSHVLLVVRPGSVLPIPSSAFATPELRNAFLSQIRQAIHP